MKGIAFFLILFLSVALTYGGRRCSTNADCNCGFVCAERDRSSKVMSPCSSEGRPCRCHKGCILADMFIPAGESKNAYCNHCSCSENKKQRGAPMCTKRAWCDLPAGVPLYPEAAPCPSRRP